MSKRPNTIPFPIHPTEHDLPRSTIRLKLCGGKVAEIHDVPIQGRRTLTALLATLEIWRDSIVTDTKVSPMTGTPRF